LPLPPQGHVLGIDIGYSAKRASSAVCRLSWNKDKFEWHIGRFKYDEIERRKCIENVAGKNEILVAAFDGPLRGDLEVIGKYRMAERALTRRLGLKIGKPGQSSSQTGKLLNNATNQAVRCLLEINCLATACHDKAIHEFAIVEAFPSSFMGLLLPEASIIAGKRSGKSDRYFKALTCGGGFAKLLQRLLPERTADYDIIAIKNHDDRAAFVCALTALAVAADDYTAVGDDDGWIILPPYDSIVPEFLCLLKSNAQDAAQQSFYSASEARADDKILGAIDLDVG
jgi:hypothetical protein